jgi:hypothetical protein
MKPSMFNEWVFDIDAMLEMARNEKLRTSIKCVIFNNPATIVKWSDGTKTVVKASNEPFDKEKGLAMAIAKKALGNKGNYYNQIRKWLEHPDGTKD